MKARPMSCLCGLGIALVVLSPVSGQTSTPPPTPTQIALPSGPELLQKMKEAVRAAGSGGWTIRVPGTGSWVLLSTFEIDVSGAVPRSHYVQHARPPLTQLGLGRRDERIVVGKREAFRSTYGGWICSVNSRVHLDEFKLVSLLLVLTNVVTVGEEQIVGATAWHVRAHSIEKNSIDTIQTRLDFYIDEATMLLLRRDQTTIVYKRGRRVPGTGMVRMNYSKYGVPIQIILPEHCRAR